MSKLKQAANKLSPVQSAELLTVVGERFNKNRFQLKKIAWDDVADRLKANPGALWSLNEMEMTGGEPDVIGIDERTGEFLICDCSAESPAGRRSVCYDQEGLESRKEHRPANSAVEMAAEMGIELLSEDLYRRLQQLGNFDAKTSSWILTPEPVRKLGGAFFGDWRYGMVFIYHNGAQSYYAARGFRGLIRL